MTFRIISILLIAALTLTTINGYQPSRNRIIINNKESAGREFDQPLQLNNQGSDGLLFESRFDQTNLQSQKMQSSKSPPLIHAANPNEVNRFRSHHEDNSTDEMKPPISYQRPSDEEYNSNLAARQPLPTLMPSPANTRPPSALTTSETNANNQFPWMVAIFSKKNSIMQYICAGSIINPSLVITSAHCVQDYEPSDLKLRAGRTLKNSQSLFQVQDTDVITILTHTSYIGRLNNDIALLELMSPFEFNQSQTIAATKVHAQTQNFNNLMNCFVSSWLKTPIYGDTFDGTLIKSKLTIVKIQDCQQKIERWRDNLQFDTSIICAGNNNTDDNFTDTYGGSPLLCQLNDPTDTDFHQIGVLTASNGMNPQIFINMKLATEKTWNRKTIPKSN